VLELKRTLESIETEKQGLQIIDQDTQATLKSQQDKLRLLGYRLEQGQAVPMFDVSDINKTVVKKTDLDWNNKGEDITRCDRLFPQRVNGLLRVYYSDNHSELPARLEATKKCTIQRCQISPS
jgi:hypothetical protein